MFLVISGYSQLGQNRLDDVIAVFRNNKDRTLFGLHVDAPHILPQL